MFGWCPSIVTCGMIMLIMLFKQRINSNYDCLLSVSFSHALTSTHRHTHTNTHLHIRMQMYILYMCSRVFCVGIHRFMRLYSYTEHTTTHILLQTDKDTPLTPTDTYPITHPSHLPHDARSASIWYTLCFSHQRPWTVTCVGRLYQRCNYCSTNVHFHELQFGGFIGDSLTITT